MGYIFEWDGKKAESNARKHGVGVRRRINSVRRSARAPHAGPGSLPQWGAVCRARDVQSAEAPGGGLYWTPTVHPPDLGEACNSGRAETLWRRRL